MSMVENKMSAGKQIAEISSSAGADTCQLEALCERLLRSQPQAESLLKRLLARAPRVGKPSAFASIQQGRCSACHMAIATGRVQQAKTGTFINCANCTIFLYSPT